MASLTAAMAGQFDGFKLYEQPAGPGGVDAGEPPLYGATPAPITAMVFVPLV